MERYLSPVGEAFLTIMNGAVDLSHGEALQMAVKGINESVGSDDLTSTLLVYSAVPHLGFFQEIPAADMC